MKTKCILLSLLSLFMVSSLEAKPNLDKIRKSLIGNWYFDSKFNFYASDEGYRRTSDNPCLINQTYHFYEDGTCEIKTKNAEECDKTEKMYWKVVPMRDAQGKERVAIRFAETEALQNADENDPEMGKPNYYERMNVTSYYRLFLLVDINKKYFSWNEKKRNSTRLPDGQVKDVWLDFFKRIE